MFHFLLWWVWAMSTSPYFRLLSLCLFFFFLTLPSSFPPYTIIPPYTVSRMFVLFFSSISISLQHGW